MVEIAGSYFRVLSDEKCLRVLLIESSKMYCGIEFQNPRLMALVFLQIQTISDGHFYTVDHK